MKKHTLQFTLAMILVGSAGSVFAADNSAQVVVTGRVTEATCDIGLQGLTGNRLFLGSYVPTVFTDVTTLVGTKKFQIGLSNCTTSTVGGASKRYGLDVSGANQIVGHADLFADLPAQTVGIELQNVTTGTPEVVPASGKFIPLSTDDKPATGNGATALFEASMISPLGPTPAVQDVQGTILFVADYR